MKADSVLRAEGLSKRYMIGSGPRGASYTALRDVISNRVRSGMRWHSGRGGYEGDKSAFWALRDVNFTVRHGEALGIVGRNGAGKSTLLKLLTRITEPTEGKIAIRGRVASLLEVGTGFHPELTGRENIFLNGAILGMKHAEIKAKFDEIVEFAEVARFLDTPVKRYSSGMYMRLAFAVAANLEPDILVIDEVLAVGDSQFQQKCLGKMSEVAHGEGRTVLFVSHNLDAVRALCSHALYLVGGQVAAYGGVGEVLALYEKSARDAVDSIRVLEKELVPGLTLNRIVIEPNPAFTGDKLTVSLGLFAEDGARISELSILIYSANGVRIAILDLRAGEGYYRLPPGSPQTISATIDHLPLIEGMYEVGVWLNADRGSGDFFNLVSLSVATTDMGRTIVPYPAHARGLVSIPYAIGPLRAESAS